jgi:hypothetical protein
MVTSTSAVETTRFENPDFAITLPAAWTERSSEEGREFASRDGVHQVIVAVLILKKALPSEGRRAVLEQLVETRCRAFQQLSGGLGQLIPVGGGPDGDCWVASLAGADVRAGMLCYVRMVATPARLVTASVYRHGDASDPPGFARMAEAICGGLQVSSSPAQVGWRRWLPW